MGLVCRDGHAVMGCAVRDRRAYPGAPHHALGAWGAGFAFADGDCVAWGAVESARVGVSVVKNMPGRLWVAL